MHFIAISIHHPPSPQYSQHRHHHHHHFKRIGLATRPCHIVSQSKLVLVSFDVVERNNKKGNRKCHIAPSSTSLQPTSSPPSSRWRRMFVWVQYNTTQYITMADKRVQHVQWVHILHCKYRVGYDRSGKIVWITLCADGRRRLASQHYSLKNVYPRRQNLFYIKNTNEEKLYENKRNK